MSFHLVSHSPSFYVPDHYREYRLDPNRTWGGTLGLVKKFDSPDGPSIVIKKIANPLETKEKGQRVHRALNCMHTIQHENIAQFIGTYKKADETGENEAIYIITEYCGETLRERIDGGRYTMADAKKWTRQMFTVIQHLHSHRVVFRNLEPKSICIDANGNLKLIGFGNARVLNRNDAMTANRGAQPYMPIELALEWTEPYNEKVDIWSAAAILCEIITGQAIFKDDKNSFKLQLEYCGPIEKELFEKMKDNSHRKSLEALSNKVSRKDFIKILRDKMQPERGIGVADIDGSEDSMRDFIEHTLQFNPNNRMSAEQCLAHRFLLDLQPWEVDLPEDEDQAMAELGKLINQEVDASPKCL